MKTDTTVTTGSAAPYAMPAFVEVAPPAAGWALLAPVRARHGSGLPASGFRSAICPRGAPV